MKIRNGTIEDFDAMVLIIMSYDKVYGADSVSTGLQDHHIELLKLTLTNPIFGSVVAENDNGTIVGFCIQKFIIGKLWILNICYIAKLDEINQYNASKIGGLMLDKLIEDAEAKDIFEFWYAVRDSGKKRLGLTLAVTENTRERYEFIDEETLPPLTKSTNEKIATNILGIMNGKNTKAIIIRHGVLKK
jgi:hypothetical protein